MVRRCTSLRTVCGLLAAVATGLSVLALPPVSAAANAAVATSPVTGVVTGPEGAVAGARVRISAAGSTHAEEVVAGNDGAFSVSVPAGEYTVQALPAADNLARLVAGAAEPVSVDADGVAEDLELLAATHVGRVVRAHRDGASTAYQGAVVRAVDYSSPTYDTVEVVSASDGSYALRLSPTSGYALSAVPAAPNPDLLGVASTYLERPAGPGAPELTLPLPTLTGVVLKPNGDPAPHAVVELSNNASDWVRDRVTATHDGRFGFTTDPGDYDVVARPASGSDPSLAFGRADAAVVTGALQPPHVTVRLQNANATGRVLGVDGTPVAESTVEARDEAENVVDTATTDAAGSWGMYLPAGTHAVVAYPAHAAAYDTLPGVTTVAVTAPDSPVAGHDVTLQRADVVGRIVDPAGRGVPHHEVRLRTTAGGRLDAAVPSYVAAHTEPDGRFALLSPSDGTYAVATGDRYPDFAPAPLTVTTTAQQTDLGDVALVAPTLTGTVRDSAGVGRAATLTVIDLASRKTVSLGDRQAGRPDGSFALRLPKGEYRVLATPFGEPTLGRADALATVDGAARLDLTVVPQAALAWVAERVSVSASGGEPNGVSEHPRMTPSASHVAFESTATNLVSTVVTGRQVYVRDVAAGRTELVSVSSSGAPGSEGSADTGMPMPTESGAPTGGSTVRSTRPAISDDGNLVVFASTAVDLVDGDTNGVADVFLRDRAAGTTTMLSRTPEGLANGASETPAISGDGRFVAFASTAGNLVPGVTAVPEGRHVYLLDRTTGTLTAPFAATGDASAHPALSGDGSKLFANVHQPEEIIGFDPGGVEMSASSIEAATAHTAAGWSVAVAATSGGAPTTIAHTSDLNIFDNELSAPSPTTDGTKVAFAARALSTPGDESSPRHGELTPVIATLPTTQWISAAPATFTDAPALRGAPLAPALLSADGSTLSFGAADSLAQTSTRQVWVTELDGRGRTRSVTLGANGAGGDNVSSARGLSANGRVALVESNAQDLVASTRESTYDTDVYLVRRNDDRTPPTWAAADTALRVTDIGTTLARLRWEPASDVSGVAKYRVLRDGKQIAETAETTLLLEGLAPDTAYRFEIVAVDRAENASTVNPTASVRTLSEASQALLVASSRPGGQADLTWELGSATDTYRVYRTLPGKAPTVVAALPAGTSRHADGGIPADTTATYEVRKVVSGGVERPHTAAASVTTGPLSLSSVDLGVTQGRGGLAKLDSDVAIEVRGEPHRIATARVDHLTWYDGEKLLDAPAAATATVELSDRAQPGVYRGSFRLAEGVREVTAVVGVLTDGTGTGRPGDGHTLTANATRIPITPASRISVTPVGAPDGGLNRSTVVVVGASDRLTAKTDGAPVAADIAPGADYAVSLLDADRRRIGSRQGVTVRPGLTSEVDVTAVLPAAASVAVTTSAGRPVAGATVRAQGADGSYLGSGSSDSTGLAHIHGDLSSGQPVTFVVAPRLQDGLLGTGTATATLVPGDNTVAVALPDRPSGTVTGIVRDATGRPVSNALVTLSQDGVPRLERQTHTDGSGGYALTGLGAPAVLRASLYGGSAAAAVTIPAGGTVTQDLALRGPTTYSLRLDVFTRTPGSAYTGPVTLDRFTSRSIGLVVSGPVGAGGWQTVASDGSNTVSVQGLPGDVFTVCGHAPSRAGVTGERSCVDVPLGDAPEVSAELRLGPAAVVTVPVHRADGSSYSGGWTATVSQQLSDGTWQTHRTVDGEGPTLRTDLPTGGVWRFAVSDGHASGVAERLVPDGTEPTTEPLRLRVPRHLAAAPATGTNAVVATRDTVRSGELIDLRASVTNGGSGLAGTVLRLGVPAGTTAVLDGVLVDGKPATGVTTGSGALDVPLGAIAAGATRTVRYQLRVDAASAALAYTLTGELRYPLGGGTETEALGSDTVTADVITLDAPLTTATDTLAVSGVALPDSSVRVYDGTTLLTTTAATAGGVWQATVTLPKRPVYGVHVLRAETDTPSGVLTSPRVAVRDDADIATVTQMRVSQPVGSNPDGRTFAWDPRQGAARFPFIVNPHHPTTVRVTFDRPALADQVQVHLGETAVPAKRQEDGSWLATATGAVKGDISATWRKVAAPKPLGVPETQRPALAEVRAEVPALLEGAEVLSATPATVAEDGTTTASATLSLPSQGEGSTLTVTSSRSDGSGYTPTAEDYAAARRTGVALYGLAFAQEVSEDGSSMTVRMTAYVPEASLNGTDPAMPEDEVAAASDAGLAASSSLGGDGSGVVRMAALPAKLVKVTMDLSTDLVARNAADWGRDAVAAAQAIAGADKYKRIIEIRNKMKCPEKQTGLARHLDQQLPELALKTDLLNVAAGLIGAVVATVGGPVGAAGSFGATQYLGYVLDNNMNGFLDRAERDVEFFNQHCDNDGKDYSDFGRPAPNDGSGTGGTGTAGTPVWIYDPSGYVYDTVHQDRISGVTATLLIGATDEGPWSLWNADWYGQRNPLSTDAEGKYAWDVPEGWWKVQLDKPGYQTTYSAALRVLPPQLDVNLGMVRTAAPRFASVAADSSALTLSFDSWMDPATLTTADPATVTVTGPGGAAVPGTVTALDPQPVPGTDRSAAKAFRFTPTASLEPSTAYDVLVTGTALSAHGRPTGAETVQSVTTGAAAAQPPAPVDPPAQADPPAPVDAPAPADQPAPVDPGAPAVVGDTGATGAVPAGGSLATSGGVASAANPVVTSVTTPQGGVVRIAEEAVGDADRPTAGYALLGQRVGITAPGASAAAPLRLAFRLDRSLLPAAENAATVSVQRNGAVVARSCAAADRAEPDPCVVSRVADGDDVVVTVLTTAASVWTFLTPEPGGLAAACPAGAEGAAFDDVPADSVHARAIECLRSLRITKGVGGDTYGPDASVERGQMASFLAQLLTAAGYELPGSPRDAFRDDGDSVHERSIDALAAAGVVKGLTASTYGPTETLSRAQMASLLDRVYVLLGGVAGEAAPDAFGDDRGNVHATAIDRLAALGVTTGVRPGAYGPDLVVRRDQMASFLTRLLSRTIAEGTVSLRSR